MQTKNNGVMTILAATVAVLLVLVLNDARAGYGESTEPVAPAVVSGVILPGHNDGDPVYNAHVLYRFWSDGTVDRWLITDDGLRSLPELDFDREP
ncbi:MAG: hypothetical protein ACYTGR_19180 [Planctomycetota bacterium]|jgi:hypothetical protein